MKVICDKKDAKNANMGFGNRWVIGDTLIFKGADIYICIILMHRLPKTDHLRKVQYKFLRKMVLDIVTLFSLTI